MSKGKRSLLLSKKKKIGLEVGIKKIKLFQIAILFDEDTKAMFEVSDLVFIQLPFRNSISVSSGILWSLWPFLKVFSYHG